MISHSESIAINMESSIHSSGKGILQDLEVCLREFLPIHPEEYCEATH